MVLGSAGSLPQLRRIILFHSGLGMQDPLVGGDIQAHRASEVKSFGVVLSSVFFFYRLCEILQTSLQSRDTPGSTCVLVTGGAHEEGGEGGGNITGSWNLTASAPRASLTTALKCLASPRTSSIVEKWKPVDIKFFREDFLYLF